MPCSDRCACLGSDPPVECLAVVDPANFAFFRSYCESGDPIKRMHVLNRSRIAAGDPATLRVPGLLQRAASLGKAIVYHVAAGLPGADDETVESRLATCQACEKYDADRRVCKACGCFLDVKICWAEQKCPLGKW